MGAVLSLWRTRSVPLSPILSLSNCSPATTPWSRCHPAPDPEVGWLSKPQFAGITSASSRNVSLGETRQAKSTLRPGGPAPQNSRERQHPYRSLPPRLGPSRRPLAGHRNSSHTSRTPSRVRPQGARQGGRRPATPRPHRTSRDRSPSRQEPQRFRIELYDTARERAVLTQRSPESRTVSPVERFIWVRSFVRSSGRLAGNAAIRCLRPGFACSIQTAPCCASHAHRSRKLVSVASCRPLATRTLSSFEVEHGRDPSAEDWQAVRL